MGGQEIFEVEHFMPRSKFEEKSCEYANLYYACRGCNSHKSETWPSEESATRGFRFVDPCEEDPYGLHLQEAHGGIVKALTNAGRYTSDHIRLNRPDLKDWRLRREKARKDLPEFEALAERLEGLQSTLDSASEKEASRQLRAVREYTDELRRSFLI
jgi:hypothetical protein